MEDNIRLGTFISLSYEKIYEKGAHRLRLMCFRRYLQAYMFYAKPCEYLSVRSLE